MVESRQPVSLSFNTAECSASACMFKHPDVVSWALSEKNQLSGIGRPGWVGSMSNARIFRYFKTSPEIICRAVMMVVRTPLSLRNVEDVALTSAASTSPMKG